jgi:hypothetical protein
VLWKVHSKDHAMAALYAGRAVRRSRQPRYTTIRDATETRTQAHRTRRNGKPRLSPAAARGMRHDARRLTINARSGMTGAGGD